MNSPDNYKEPEFYDRIFNTNEKYWCHWSKSIYIEPWTYILKDYLYFIPTIFKILDVGCGPGQFGEMLYDHGYDNYLGIDFSEAAISIAKKNYRQKYEVGNCLEFDLNSYDLIVSLEVLEHLKDDLAFVERIPKGTQFIFSVPNYPGEAHVRTFETVDEIKSYYSGLLDISRINSFVIESLPSNLIFTIDSERK